MLTAEQNDRLTQVGPGTPMGELMRRYWIPIRPCAQLLDEKVMAVRILGEDLVLFRAKNGNLGLVGQICPHRNAQLKYGFPGEDGIRCCYHGWMFDGTGQCIDTPMEVPGGAFKDNIKITGYPVQELGGLVWAYMGPEPTPLLPPWSLLVFPNALRQIGIAELDCNWLQCHENTGDPTHSAYLHGHYFKFLLEQEGKLDDRAADEETHTLYGRMKLERGIESLWVNPTKHGMEKGINYSKSLGADRDYKSRHSTVIFPFFTQTGGPTRPRQEFQIRVPIDDTHTYHINYGCYLAPPKVQVPEQEVIPWYNVPLYDDNGKPLLDFVLAQDAHAWISQGPITDRTKEHLGRTDIPIVFMRRQFEEQMAIVEDGGEPMNVFRDPNQMPDLIHGGIWDEKDSAVIGVRTGVSNFRTAYHKGYGIDDADRYGPAMPLVIEMMQKIEELQTAEGD